MSGLRWGIMGTGWIADLQTGDLVGNGFTVSAVGSRRQETADAFASKFGIPNAHSSYEALVADPEVDIVYIATPHPLHMPNAILALDAGKHVLLEKPFAMNADQARTVIDHAASKDLLVLEAMWMRFLPHILRAKEIVAAGTIGEVRKVNVNLDQLSSRDPLDRSNNPALGGGALLDRGTYTISFAYDFLGAPSGIQAQTSLTDTGIDDQTSMLFSYPGGQHAVLTSALQLRGPNTAVILGTEGRIEIERTWYRPADFTVFDNDDNVVERFESKVPGRGMQFQAWEAERLVAEGLRTSPRIPSSETIQIMKTLDEVRRLIGLEYPE